MSKKEETQLDIWKIWENWDAEKEARCIEGWIADYFSSQKLERGVIGLSGGRDSSVVAGLLSDAIGAENVLGVLLPETECTNNQDIQDAMEVASKFGIETKLIDITPILEAHAAQSPELTRKDSNGEYVHKDAWGNVKARVRMTELYKESQLLRYRSIVVGTTDKTEWLMGYFTKHGDGGTDIEPVLNVYKTQMKLLGKQIGVPERAYQKPPSPNLIPGRTAKGELGLGEEGLDMILCYLFEYGFINAPRGKILERFETELGIDSYNVSKVLDKYNSTHHKRKLSPSPPVREF